MLLLNVYMKVSLSVEIIMQHETVKQIINTMLVLFISVKASVTVNPVF